MTTHFIVHEKKDTVGVVVVEDVKPGMTLTGWVMEGDGTIQVKALDAVPLGHKVALKDIKSGDTVIKYGNDIGKAVADIPTGKHAQERLSGAFLSSFLSTLLEALGDTLFHPARHDLHDAPLLLAGHGQRP